MTSPTHSPASPEAADVPNTSPLSLKWVLVLLAVFGVCAGGWAYRQNHRYKHVAIHDPGKVIRCAWVEADVMAELVEKHQVKTVLNLCRPGEMGPTRALDERAAVEAAGAKLIELSLPDLDDPGHPEIAAHIALLKDPANYPLIVHCQHGFNRTGRVLTMYDIMFRNKTGEEALAAMPLFGRDDYAPLEHAFAKNCDIYFAEQKANEVAQQKAAEQPHRLTTEEDETPATDKTTSSQPASDVADSAKPVATR